MIRAALATVALPLLVGAGQAPPNLPGAGSEATRLNIAEQNRRAAALRSAYDRDRAAYEAALARNRAEQAGAAAAQEGYRRRIDGFSAPPVHPEIARPKPVTTNERTCVRRTGEASTGSHIARTRTRLVCTSRPASASAPAVQRNDREGIERAIDSFEPPR